MDPFPDKQAGLKGGRTRSGTSGKMKRPRGEHIIGPKIGRLYKVLCIWKIFGTALYMIFTYIILH